MNVSIVSVSRVAFPPQQGHVVSRKVFDVRIGDFPFTLKSTSSGSLTGSWSSGTG